MSSGRGIGLFRVDATKPIVLVVAGHVTPADVARLRDGLGEELHRELAGRAYGTHPAEVICDVGGLDQPNLAAVHVLAALWLDARRRGCPLRLRGVGRELRQLLELVGLGVLAKREADEAGEGRLRTPRDLRDLRDEGSGG